MQEIKQTSKWFILTSVLYVVTGLVMIVWPNLTMEMLGKVLSIGMLVVGIGHIIIYFTKDHMESILHMDLTIGVILAAFGAFMLFHEEFVSMALPFGVGILLLIGGIMKIQHSIDMRRLGFRKWAIMLVFAIILIGLGMVLVYNPFEGSVLIYYMAGCLILNGILSVICVLLISHKMKKLAKAKYGGIVNGYETPSTQIQQAAAAPADGQMIDAAPSDLNVPANPSNHYN